MRTEKKKEECSEEDAKKKKRKDTLKKTAKENTDIVHCGERGTDSDCRNLLHRSDSIVDDTSGMSHQDAF